MQTYEAQYLLLLRDLAQKLVSSAARPDRTGTGTASFFGRMLEHDLSLGLPLLTTKKVHIKSAIHELLWFLQGSTNTKYLRDNGVTIWDEWALEDGSLGPVYGFLWRSFPGPDGKAVDQVGNLIESIRTRPYSRRHIISAWHPALLPIESLSPQENVRLGRQALAACHVQYQFHVEDGKLSCMLTQRSADIFLGAPFNCLELALLTHMVAQQCDLLPGRIIHSLGDVHLYSNHLEQAKMQIQRQPRACAQLHLRRKPDSIFEYRFEDFDIQGYDPHPAIKAPVAV